MLRTMKRSMTMTIAMMMVASIFAIMGLTTEQVSAATKKPAAVKSLTATASTQMVKASWKKASKVKVNKKNYVVNYQLKATVKSITGKTSSKTYTIKNATTSKTFYDHAGTKYTFKIRGYYTYKGKKVYGKWSAGKTKTIPKNGVSMSANRSSKGNVVAEARYTGNAKKQRYTTLVFSYNGAIKQCGINDYVSFPDSKAGTLTVYACYFTNGKTVKTTTTSKYIKASNVTSTTQPTTNPSNPTNNTGNTGNSGNTDNSEPSKGGDNVTGSKDPTNNTGSTQPSTGGGNSSIGSGDTGSDMNSTSDIKVEDAFIKDGLDPNNKNNFIIEFSNPIKSKYNWKVSALDNKRFRKTLNLSDDQKGAILNADYHYGYNDEYHIEIQTNWQCTNICLEAYDKSSGKKVFSKNIGWDYTYTQKYYSVAPGNYYYGGIYYNRCMQVIDYILEGAGYDEEDTVKNNIKTIKSYLFNRWFLCVKYDYSMNAKKNLGFFENKMYLPNPNANSNSYLDPTYYDYSKILAYLLGIDGGDCTHFQMLENLIVKRIDPNATITAEQITSGDLAGHATIKATMKDVSMNQNVEVAVDFSGTKYRGGYDMYESGGREANAMYNDSTWRSFFRGALGSDAAAYYGL